MDITLTYVTYYDTDSKVIRTVNVITDGKHLLTDSKAKQFLKLNIPNGKFIEKSRNTVSFDITALLAKPLQDLLKEQTNHKVYTFID